MDNVFDWSFKLMGLNGMNPRKKRNYFLIIMSLIVGCYRVCLPLLEVFVNWNGIETMSKTFLIPGGLIMNFNQVFCYNQKDRLLNLNELNIHLKSLKPNANLNNADQIRKTQKIYKIARRCQLNIYRLHLSLEIFMGITPLINRTGEVAIGGYDYCDMQKNSCFMFQVILNFITLTLFAVPAFAAKNALFIGCVADIYGSVEDLKSRFIAIDFDKSPNARHDWIQFIQHLKVLHQFIALVQDTFGAMIFTELFLDTAYLGIMIFIIVFQKEATSSDLASGIVLNTLVLCMMFIYCYFGSIVFHQPQTLAGTVFDEKLWIKNDLQVQKEVVLVLSKIQQEDGFMFMNTYKMDLELFIRINRIAFSAFTVLKNMEI